MNTPSEILREKFNQIFFENKKNKQCTEAEIAKRIGISAQVLNYQLRTAKKFDTDLGALIERELEKMGIVKISMPLNDKLHLKMMIDELRNDFNKKIDQLEEFIES